MSVMVKRSALRWFAVLLSACLGSCGDDDGPAQDRSCGFVGRSEACACTDGRTGAQVCQADGTLSTCVCTTDGAAGSTAGAAGASDGGVSGGSDGGSAGSAGAAGSSSTGGQGGLGPEGGSPNTGGAPGSGGEDGARGGAVSEGGNAGESSSGGAPGSGGAGGACAGDGCGTPHECDEGDVVGCRCSGPEAGYRLCLQHRLGACVCPGGVQGEGGSSGSGGVEPCIPEMEWCDGRDNDCNGVVDDHFACHDDSVAVANTRPFAGGVYFKGRGNTGCLGLQQVWPNRVQSYLTGFDCISDWFRFRKSDAALFYHTVPYGIFLDGMTSDARQPTPTCNGGVRAVFDFDANDVLHYQCGTTLLRGNGETVATPIQGIVAVFDDGRSLVTLGSISIPGTGTPVVLDRSGAELVRFPLDAVFTGAFTLLPRSASVAGNAGYVAFSRVYDQATTELVVYSIDEQSRFRLVRRQIVPSLGWDQLAISDGTILVQDEFQIRAYLPDNTSRVIWRASEALFVLSDNLFSHQLLTGPLAPEAAP